MGPQNDMNEMSQAERVTIGGGATESDVVAEEWAMRGRATTRVAPTIPATGETAYSRGDHKGRPSPHSFPHRLVSLWFPHRPLVWLLYLCVFELGYLLLLALSPLPGLHLYASPIAAAWSWTLLPSHVLFAIFGPLVGASPGHAWFSTLLLGITLLMLTGAYAGAIVSVLRLKDNGIAELDQNRLRYFIVLLGGAFLFCLTLLVQPKLFSDDIFTSIFSGRILAIYHADPLNTAPIQFPADPYLLWVVSGRNTPNISGPLWLCIVSLLVGLGRGPVGTLLLFKGIAILSHLLNCLLVWGILSKIAPGRRVLGSLLYAWNPLALIELAGSGHGEGVLITLLLCATWLSCDEVKAGKAEASAATIRHTGALIVFGFAISTNLITLLLAPLYIWFVVHTRRRISHALWGFCWRVLLMLVPALVIWLPFWRGASTFFAVTSAVDMEHFVHSPVGTLARPIRALFQFVADWLHFPSFLHPIPSADITLRASAIFIFALIYIDLFGQIRRAPRTVGGMRYRPGADMQMTLPGFDVLLSGWGIAVFWYLVLGSGWFWPWYMLWMLWIVVLRRFDAFTSTVLLLSATALFFYPLLGLPRVPSYQSALIFGIPLVYLFVVKRREKQQERTAATL